MRVCDIDKLFHRYCLCLVVKNMAQKQENAPLIDHSYVSFGELGISIFLSYGPREKPLLLLSHSCILLIAFPKSWRVTVFLTTRECVRLVLMVTGICPELSSMFPR